MPKTWTDLLTGSDEDKAESKSVREEMRSPGRYSLKPKAKDKATANSVGPIPLAKADEPKGKNPKVGRHSPGHVVSRRHENAHSTKTESPGDYAKHREKANAKAQTFGSQGPNPRVPPKSTAKAPIPRQKPAKSTSKASPEAPKKVERKTSTGVTTGKKHGKIVRGPAMNSGKLTPYQRMRKNAKDK